MTSARVEDAKLRAMLAACEGVTPGPWVPASNHEIARVGDMYADAGYEERMIGYQIEAPKHDDHVTERAAILSAESAIHIANCDPDTIRSILSELLELREAAEKLNAEVVGLMAVDAGIRQVIGNTNWAVLMQRSAEVACSLSQGAGHEQ